MRWNENSLPKLKPNKIKHMGRRQNTEHGFSYFLNPYRRILQFFYHCINEMAKGCFLLFCPAFQIKQSITKQQFKNIYLTLNIF